MKSSGANKPRAGAVRKGRKGPQVGSGGQGRQALEGKKPGDSITIEVQPEHSLLTRTKKHVIELGDEPQAENLPQGLL